MKKWPHLICVGQVLVEEIDYGDEDSVKQATDLLLQKELASEVDCIKCLKTAIFVLSW